MIHCYKLGGLNIVLDVYSGSVHLVDEVAYDIISMYESKTREEITAEILEKYSSIEDVTKEEISDCCDDIEELKKAGKLFKEDTFKPMAGDLKKKSAGIVQFSQKGKKRKRRRLCRRENINPPGSRGNSRRRGRSQW